MSPSSRESQATARDEATGYPTRIRRSKDGMEMVLVPGGTFWMGAVPGDALAEQVPDRLAAGSISTWLSTSGLLGVLIHL